MNSSNHSTTRIRLFIFLVVIALITLASLWVKMVIEKSAVPDITVKERSDPDYIVENFRYYKIAKSGQAQYEAKGTKLTHFPVEDSYMVDNPEMYSVNADNQLQSVTAKQAYIEDFNTKVHLIDNVILNRRESPQGKPLSITSEYILIEPDEEIMSTDKAVTIRSDKSLMHGMGMKANNVTQQLELKNRVKVTYYPPGQKAPITVKDTPETGVTTVEEQTTASTNEAN